MIRAELEVIEALKGFEEAQKGYILLSLDEYAMWRKQLLGKIGSARLEAIQQWVRENLTNCINPVGMANRLYSFLRGRKEILDQRLSREEWEQFQQILREG